MLDYAAGEVTTAEARVLVARLNERLGSSRLQFHAGVSYRHVMVWRGGPAAAKTTPPHDIIGQPLAPHLPQGDGEEKLRQLMFDSLDVLDDHDINRRRRDEGKPPANMIWLWGQGRKCELPSFAVLRGTPGIAIAAVDLVRGVAKCAGLAAPVIPGATGNLETDFSAKAEAARAAFDSFDFVLVHIEAPDEASHQASAERKVWALEQIDEKVVGPLLARLRELPGSRLLLVSDHYTKIRTKTHAREPVPFALLGPPRDASEAFDEPNAASTRRFLEEGWRLADLLFED
jgi:2,3-bisphosphoglycerate-independent phosphoglycerate mutase